jgi:pimeloyl-ACP methyl ester carboxylesterase
VEPLSKLTRVSKSSRPERGAVVFVHGLGGDAFGTWRRSEGDKSFWPEWLEQDLPELEVWTLAYEAAVSNWTGTAMALPDRATNILAELIGEGLHNRPLVFICHSLGGLVVKQLLRQAADRPGTPEGSVLEAVRGIVFIATPSAGSEVATWVDRFRSVFASTPAIKDLQADGPYLRDLAIWYRDRAPQEDIATLAFVENQNTGGLSVVDMTSGDPGVLGSRPIPLDANHIDICKPADRSATLYKRIRHFLEAELEFAEEHVSAPQLGAGPKKIFISYRRRAKADARLAQWLTQSLKERGHDVFIDVNMKIGVDWSKEIEKRIQWCDYLIVLLSEESSRSDMVQYEVQLAHDRRDADGLPVLLPVRIAFKGRLDYRLGAILDRYQYIPWESAADDGRILESILEALGAPPPTPRSEILASLPTSTDEAPAASGPPQATRPATSADPRVLRRPGSAAAQLDDPCYVGREADRTLIEMASYTADIIVLKAPKQMGKSSLVLRYLSACREHKKLTGYVDFQSFGEADFESIGSLLTALATRILREFRIDPLLARKIAMPNELTEFLEDVVFAQCPEHSSLALALDDVDRIVGMKYQNDVYAMMRAWSNRRSSHPHLGWQRFDLLLVVATETAALIVDAQQSPFNITEPIRLGSFSRKVFDELNGKFENALSEGELTNLFALVGGHPYLTRLAFWRLLSGAAGGGVDYAEFDRRAADDDGPFGEHLRAILAGLSSSPTLLTALRQLIRDGVQPTPATAYKLQAFGLAENVKGSLKPANELYCRFFLRVLT